MNLTYIIPESKKDISVERYLSISKLYKDAETNETEVTEIQLLSACLNIPIALVDKLPFKEYEQAVKTVTEALNSESTLHLTFNLNDVKYGFINDLENMSAGEYGALDKLLEDSDNNAYKILNVLYRPIVKEKFYKGLFSKNKKGTYKIQSYNHKNNTDIFKDAPFEIYESALVFFFEFRQRISKRYPELYESSGTSADDRAIRFSKKWGWYQTFDTYASAERIRIEEVELVPINKVLFRLAFESDKAKLMRPIKK